MKQRTNTLFLLFSAVLLLAVRGAEAACTPSNQTFAMPTTIVVPRDLPVGSRIGSEVITHSYTLVTGLTAKTATCSVANSVINVKLDEAKSSNLSDVGSTTGSTPFSISLKNCDTGLNLSLSLNAGSAGSSDPAKGLLSADSTSDATGLALQLMYNNAPVSLGSRFRVQGLPTVSGGNYDIPLVVRYFKTDKKITSGKINASATFTMVYN